MILIPSLEIMSGEVVCLAGEAGSEPVVLSNDPLKTVRSLRHDGAMFFHVVDLDAVLGQGNNDDVLRTFAEELVPFQVRGRITTAERANEILELGADRVVLGSLPYQDGEAAAELVNRFAMRVMATLDVKGDRVLTARNEDGENAGLDLAEAMQKLEASGVKQVIYNSVQSTGEDAELDIDKLQTVVADGAFQVYARCTVRNLEELEPLRMLHEQGLLGVILNHAMAEDSVPFATVMQAS